MNRLEPAQFVSPAVLLSGPVDQAMYTHFRQQLDQATGDLCVIELSTLGGDPEVARVMGEDVRFHSAMQPARRIVFLGKAAVYSAGVTFMSFFARENRYLSRGTRLMIHERLMSSTLNINGPLTSCIASVQAMLNQLDASIVIQNEGFANLVNGSSVPLDELKAKAPFNWYVEAREAEQLGLIEAVI